MTGTSSALDAKHDHDPEGAEERPASSFEITLGRPPVGQTDGSVQVVDPGRGAPDGEEDGYGEAHRQPGPIAGGHPLQLGGYERAERRRGPLRQIAEV